METRDFSLAGWLSIFSALLAVPIVGLAFLAGFESELPGGIEVRMGYGGTALEISSFALLVAYTAAYVWLLLEFRRLLNRSGFHGIDSLVPFLIALNILVVLIPDSWLVILIPVSLAGCGVGIVFGIRLLKFSEDPTGLLKPYAYLLIATYVCVATLILFPVAILLGLAVYVLQAMILFRAGEFPEANADPAPPQGLTNYAG